jgi:hypothetical protein
MLLVTKAVPNLHFVNFLTTPVNAIPEIVNTGKVATFFPGAQFLVALISGILMAFAFQLLLTNFSVAVGISNLGDEESESLGTTIRKVETKIGFWALITSCIALFIACFLAVKLTLVETAFLGAIIGVVVWSAYFSLLIWLGSSAVGSLLGIVVSTASSGFQGLMGTATTAIGANTAKKQAISTAEEITAAVRRELTSGFDPDGIKNSLQSSLSSLQLPKLDVQDIRNQFDLVLKDADLQSIADSDLLKNINRQTFVDLINSLGNFSQGDANKIADQLESSWKRALNKKNPTEQVINLLQSATPEELNSEQFSERLQQLVAVGGNSNKSNGSIMNKAVQYGLSAAGTVVLERLDLTDIDLEKITSQLQKLRKNVQEVDIEKITDQLKQLASQASQQANNENSEEAERLSAKKLKANVEDFIQNSFPWNFNNITFKDEFRELIYDPYANSVDVRSELEELSQEFFVKLLTQRGDISEIKVQEIAEQLENERLEVLEIVTQEKMPEKNQDLRTQIENYLRSTGKEDLNPESIKRDLSKLLEDPEASFDDLSERFSEFDRDTFIQLLQQREDISSDQANAIANELDTTRNSLLNQAKEVQEELVDKASELRGKVEDYLRNTNKDELNPEGIKRDFQVLLDDPKAGINVLRTRLSQFDRDTLVKLLSQREDLSEEQVNKVIEQLESVRDNILKAPEKVAEKAKEQYKRTTTAIADYLRNTNLEELNPEAILTDLSKLPENPQEGASALAERLSNIDRETLVKLLAQPGDLSEEQINQSIDRLEEAVTSITKTPGRLARQATKKVADFESTLENYLRNTNKEELNPEGIKRDLQLLLQHPRAGVGNLSDRLSKFDRSTIVALLSQREDISEEEAVNIVEQIESVRNSISEQFQQLQQKLQSVVDNIFGKIRDYLNSLNLPELNYEGIQQDFAKLFEDPQAGFDALRQRLSQFDRETLVAIVSSREDISEEQANRIVNQIEKGRDEVLHRAERIQEEVKKRLQSIKQQAHKQAEEAKNTVAGAAWWLFSTGFTSLAASVIAGVIAVRGFNF